MSTCQCDPMCQREATHRVEINAPVTGYHHKGACPEHAKKMDGDVYVRSVVRVGADE